MQRQVAWLLRCHLAACRRGCLWGWSCAAWRRPAWFLQAEHCYTAKLTMAKALAGVLQKGSRPQLHSSSPSSSSPAILSRRLCRRAQLGKREVLPMLLGSPHYQSAVLLVAWSDGR